jgi:GT2 family glycosyltransferase
MDLSVIIVSWNVQEKLKENLRALWQSQGDLRFEVFVVDNNSADATVEMVKKEFPQVKLITNDKNLGFAKANNQGIRQAQGDFILLLNPDMKVRPDTLINMIKWMKENKQAGVAGCHLVDKRGNTVKQVRRFPTVWDQLAIVLKLPHLFPKILNKYLRIDFDYSQPAKVDSIRGGFMMIRTSPPTPLLIRRGEVIPPWRESRGEVLDERYFLWFEEVDFCCRIYKAGGEVWYTPAAQCLDYVGQSFKQLPRGKTQKYFRNSQLAYFKKWHPAWQYWVLKLTWPLGLFIAWLGDKLNLKSEAKT